MTRIASYVSYGTYELVIACQNSPGTIMNVTRLVVVRVVRVEWSRAHARTILNTLGAQTYDNRKTICSMKLLESLIF